MRTEMNSATRTSIIRTFNVSSTTQSEDLLPEFLTDIFGGFTNRDLSVEISKTILQNMRSPNKQKSYLEQVLGNELKWVHVTGTIEDRVFLLGETDRSGLIFSLGSQLEKVLEAASVGFTNISPITEYSASFQLTEEQKSRILQPKTFLVSLYHPENFPLPRFALGISDIARAIRKYLFGEVHLFDMQLGLQISDIKKRICEQKPDIIGISATFGQYDLLEELLDFLANEKSLVRPTVVVGGSLGALNKEKLIERGDVDFVAVGAGERAMQDIIMHWRGYLPKEKISDVTYRDDNALVHTQRINNRLYNDIMPELDLLDETLALGGVMQLESSRGCSYACSFCPREHKGIWAGEDSAVLDRLLPEISAAFDRQPLLDRRIFLVDEEFVGYQREDLATARCEGFASRLSRFGFGFETSSRIDQVARRNRDADWHIGRMRFWKNLCSQGLIRCLFGIEAGVDSVLERFNKKTTADQNALGIRILTSMNVPIRCTFITFDPMMSFEELKETCKFLGRTDLVMNDLSQFEESLVFSGLHDEGFVAEHSKRIPFYHLVSYMLVSMEALSGSDYLRQVEEAGLAGGHNVLMGRREVTYRDSRIGELSRISQLWVDRNFSLDYTLKSIEKVLPLHLQKTIKWCRIMLREAAFQFLSEGIDLIELKAAELQQVLFDDDFLEIRFKRLKSKLLPVLSEAIQNIPDAQASRLDEESRRWSLRQGWTLINGVCE